MRIKRTNIILVLLLITWSSVLYFTLSYRPIYSSEPSQKVNKQIVILEEGISEQFNKNNAIINDAQKLLELKKKGSNRDTNLLPPELQDVKIPVLVFACNRITITRCLDNLIRFRPDPDQFPIIVSQDCSHDETKEVIQSYGNQVSLMQQPDQSDIQVGLKEKKFKGYFKIARHYGWALNQIFFNFNFSSVIIVEAWNDNGKEGLVNADRPDLLYRTDFFPGLGWMLTKSLWLELYTKWPRAYWDDWMRDPLQRKGRSCIRPEISRTRTFGKVGVSNGMFFENHLKYIKLNEQFVPFTKMNLSYLIKENYDRTFVKAVYQSPIINYQDLREGRVTYEVPVRIMYRNKDDFKLISKKLGLMDDLKVINTFVSGVPRTAYKGIVTFHYKGKIVHFAPSANWVGYDVSWS
ncbi:hypothetical protein NQ317_014653 [Molorchus minor]|uniref:Alpha-1,3-mannosyl-glycoprotein 2-beta-N-acetylglucosaminyltransferase n=1 Tax=Molorchus minor TaxID=1323400 RepID=A0ABQ9JQ89_9CUCU|nr:hypothetical protein NQ317_014653 [Molorchus minor]